MTDGMILPGYKESLPGPNNCRIANALGFTEDKFNGWLWREGDWMIISFIISKQPGRGNFTRLLKKLDEMGFGVRVPTPTARMEEILLRMGFRPGVIWDETYQGQVRFYEKESSSLNGPMF